MNHVSFSILRSLYTYAIAGSFKSNYENDTEFSKMSAFMAMNNLMPYYLPDVVNKVTNAQSFNVGLANNCVKSVSNLIKPINTVNTRFKLPTASEFTDTVMSTVWDALFSAFHYWPEYCRSPFGNGQPLHTRQIHEKIAYTGSKLSTFFGKSTFALWRDTWSFPVSKAVRTALESSFEGNVPQFVVSSTPAYVTEPEFTEFVHKMTNYMGDVGDFIWLPIAWPSKIANHAYAPKITEDFSYPVDLDVYLVTLPLGFYNELNLLYDLCKKCTGMWEAQVQAMNPEESIETHHNELIDDLELMFGLTADDIFDYTKYFQERYAIVNQTLSVIRAFLKGYTMLQTSS